MNQPFSYIHPEAKIANNVVIEPFTTISKNVTIDRGTWVGPNVTIMEGARIGKNCKIFPGAVIAAVPQDLKFNGESTTVEIWDNTVIRECVTISRGAIDKYKTTIGKNCLLMAYVHIAHDCSIGNHCILANVVQVGGHVQIQDYAIIGGMVVIHQFVKIGAHIMISGGGRVPQRDIPPYIKAAREPLQYCGINSIGLRRRGFTNEKINEIQTIYRYIFQKGLPLPKALEAIELDINPSKERDEILSFIKNADRGIIRETPI